MLWELATGVEAWTNSRINTMVECTEIKLLFFFATYNLVAVERQVKAKKRPCDFVKVHNLGYRGLTSRGCYRTAAT